MDVWRSRKKRIWWWAGSVLIAVLMSGCFPLVSRTPQPPLLYILEPVAGASVRLGEPVRIRGFWSGEDVRAVTVRVNGKLQTAALIEAPLLTAEWTPKEIGAQVLFLEALDASGRVIARSDVLVVNVVAVAPSAPPPPTLEPPPQSPSPTSFATTPALVATATPALVPTPTPNATESSNAPILVSLVTLAPTPSPTPLPPLLTPPDSPTPQLAVTYFFARVRAGPGTFYPQVGQLDQGEVVTATGRTADQRWWRILYNNSEAWVFGELVSANAAAANVPIVTPPAPPAPPTLPAPTSTPTPSPALMPLAPSPTPTPEWVCTPDSPQWAARLNPTSPSWTFCVAQPLDFMPSGHPDEMALIWHVYGDIKQVELLVESAELGCGKGPESEQKRWLVPPAMAGFAINRATFALGGYKILLAITLNDGRTERYGGLNFCGTR